MSADKMTDEQESHLRDLDYEIEIEGRHRILLKLRKKILKEELALQALRKEKLADDQGYSESHTESHAHATSETWSEGTSETPGTSS